MKPIWTILLTILQFQLSTASCQFDSKNPNFLFAPDCNQSEYCSSLNRDSKFSPETKTCVLPLHAFCGYVDEPISCPQNAVCSDNYYTSRCTCDHKSLYTSGEEKCELGKLYLETCDPDNGGPPNGCASLAGLSCRGKPSVCKCKESSAVWNPIDSYCYSEPDCMQDNRYATVDTSLNPPVCIGRIGANCGPLVRKTTCPKNSDCSEDRCVCNDNYMASDDQESCLLIKYYGDACNDSDNAGSCLPDAKLTCLSTGVCGCQEGQLWNPQIKECRLAEGKRCKNVDNECVRHASCSFYSYSYGYGICGCDDGYQAENGHCIGEHLSRCEFNDDCRSGLSCTDGLCQCPGLLHEFYYNKLNQCVRLAGSTCSAEGDACTTNARCIDGVCKCQEGTRKTDKGNCAEMKGHGDICSKGECDFGNGLACVSGKCDCFDNSLVGKDCLAKVGEECGLLRPVGSCSSDTDQTCEHYNVNCEASASCQHIAKGTSRCQLRSASTHP